MVHPLKLAWTWLQNFSRLTMYRRLLKSPLLCRNGWVQWPYICKHIMYIIVHTRSTCAPNIEQDMPVLTIAVVKATSIVRDNLWSSDNQDADKCVWMVLIYMLTSHNYKIQNSVLFCLYSCYSAASCDQDVPSTHIPVPLCESWPAYRRILRYYMPLLVLQ